MTTPVPVPTTPTAYSVALRAIAPMAEAGAFATDPVAVATALQQPWATAGPFAPLSMAMAVSGVS